MKVEEMKNVGIVMLQQNARDSPLGECKVNEHDQEIKVKNVLFLVASKELAGDNPQSNYFTKEIRGFY
jgi:hypothetical protein